MSDPPASRILPNSQPWSALTLPNSDFSVPKPTSTLWFHLQAPLSSLLQKKNVYPLILLPPDVSFCFSGLLVFLFFPFFSPPWLPSHFVVSAIFPYLHSSRKVLCIPTVQVMFHCKQSHCSYYFRTATLKWEPLKFYSVCSVCLNGACKQMHLLGCFMHNRVWCYECRVRKGKILFPGFLQCEKRGELSRHEDKTLIVIFNLFGYGQPSVDTYLALSTRKELRIRFAWRHRTKMEKQKGRC